MREKLREALKALLLCLCVFAANPLNSVAFASSTKLDQESIRTKVYRQFSYLDHYISKCVASSYFELSVTHRIDPSLPKATKEGFKAFVEQSLSQFPADPTAEFVWQSTKELMSSESDLECRKVFKEATQGLWGGRGKIESSAFEIYGFFPTDEKIPYQFFILIKIKK